MARTPSRLQRFSQGQEWSPVYARHSLPVLVSWIEQQRGKPDLDIQEFSYKDLAQAVGQPNHAHPIHESLGILGFALQELEAEQKPGLGVIPPIQLLVWSKGEGSPGDDGFNFLGISKQELATMSKALRQATARHVRATILDYPHWRRVLAELGLKAISLDLPAARNVVAANATRGGGGEGQYHAALKRYLAENYWVLGLSGEHRATLEHGMLSGDIADLMLDGVASNRRVCVEVKSRISDEADLIRGLFQCVKYKAVLRAQERYEAARSADYASREIITILATECPLAPALVALARLIDVPVKVVNIP